MQTRDDRYKFGFQNPRVKGHSLPLVGATRTSAGEGSREVFCLILFIVCFVILFRKEVSLFFPLLAPFLTNLEFEIGYLID